MDEQKSIINLPQRRAWHVQRPPRDYSQPRPERARETCPTCRFPLEETSHGWIRAGFDEDSKRTILVKCPMCSGGVEAKRQAQLINDLFGDAHIPWYARDWSFQSCHKTEAYTEVMKFVQGNLAGAYPERGLYLVGDKGIGKTGLAISALQSILRKGRSGVFLTTIELFDLLRGSISASKRIERGDNDFENRYEASIAAKLLRLAKTVEWLVLDDLGVECGTKYVIQQLYAILEARRGEGLFTIFTSNRDAADLEQYWRSDQDGVFADGLRIIDRLGEYCLVVPVTGTNQRMSK